MIDEKLKKEIVKLHKDLTNFTVTLQVLGMPSWIKREELQEGVTVIQETIEKLVEQYRDSNTTKLLVKS